nr:hypothetical protein HmN_000134800 [Hymenolepis microstoma]
MLSSFVCENGTFANELDISDSVEVTQEFECALATISVIDICDAAVECSPFGFLFSSVAKDFSFSFQFFKDFRPKHSIVFNLATGHIFLCTFGHNVGDIVV